jgi:hypothetical protein
LPYERAKSVDEKKKKKEKGKTNETHSFWYTASSRYSARNAWVREAIEKGYSKTKQKRDRDKRVACKKSYQSMTRPDFNIIALGHKMVCDK